MDWRHRAACLDEDPELFFPIGNTGPALVQIEDAKAVCRRCEVVDTCLKWAIETGQDAGVEGLQNILRGDQCMTIYKSYAQEADAASKLAIALVKGQDPTQAGVTLTDFQDPKGNRTLKAYLLPAQIVTKSNVKIVVDSGQVSAKDLCNGLAAQCAAAGIK